MDTHADPRRQLLEIFAHALAAVHGTRCVAAHLAAHPIESPIYVIAIGKAACAMARGARDVLGSAIADALVITKRGHTEPLPWPVIEAAHPVPDETSLVAGDRLIQFATTIPRSAQVLVLLSGGASALAEKLPDGVGIDAVRALNEWLLASGRDIVTMNRFRRRLSLIKDGRLAILLAPRAVTCLAISDVPGDDPRAIGSGPLTPDSHTLPDFADAPPAVRAALTRSPPSPSPSDARVTQVQFVVVANLDMAKRAAESAVAGMGMRAQRAPEFVSGDAVAAGARFARALLSKRPGVVHIGGGETTVTLPANPGRGGRCQQFALAAAQTLVGHDRVYLLAAGTDGTDGPTSDAGALVDGETVARGARVGLDAHAALSRADAGSFLAASGDLIHTGPTGTNVMDLLLALRL